MFGHVYLLAGGPSNVAIQVGDEGVLLVDAATAAVSDRVLEAVRALSDGPLSYIINTTSDREHYGGNARLGRAGLNPTVAPRGLAGPGSAPDDNQGGGGNNPVQLRPTGAIVIAHENLLNRMNVEPTAEPFEMWPSNSFFTAKKTMWFNDEPIEILHAPAAHTDGDVLVFFRRSDVVVAGDVIHTERYPPFDVVARRQHARHPGRAEPHHRHHRAPLQPARRHARGAGPRPHPQRGRRRRVPRHDDHHLRPREGRRRRRPDVRADHASRKPTLEYDGLYSTPAWTGRMLDAGDLRRAATSAPTAPSSAQ